MTRLSLYPFVDLAADISVIPILFLSDLGLDDLGILWIGTSNESTSDTTTQRAYADNPLNP